MLIRAGSHSGTRGPAARFADFNLYHTLYSANMRTAPHEHEHPMLVVPLAGDGLQTVEGTTALRSPGVQRFHLGGERHWDRVGPDGWEMITIELLPGLREHLADFSCESRRGFDFATADGLYLGWRLARCLADAKQQPLSAASIAYEMLASLTVQTSRAAPRSGWLGVAREYIHVHFRERPTLDEIAAAAHVHPVHLARTFRSRYGVTVGAFVRELALDEACRLLRNGDLCIGEIAQAIGYTPTHFSQLFMRTFAVTPASVRDAGRVRTVSGAGRMRPIA
jgi:AraC family transcriptional regulator